jgi:hypothetical protein
VGSVRIWTFDPGAVATGLAFVHWYGQPVVNPSDQFWWQNTDIENLYDDFLHEEPTWWDVILVEDYSHGGAFTLEAKKTIEVVGFLVHQLSRDGYTVIRRHKDKRLSGQAEAARLMGSTVATLKKDPTRKDAFSALAHSLTYTREVEPR